MKIVYTFALMALLAGSLKAQQQPHFSQYMINNYILNPAISGIEDYTDVKSGFRRQWMGLEGAPLTYYTSAHMPLNKTDITVSALRNKDRRIKRIGLHQKARPHHGIGVIAQVDKTGPLKSTSFNASYAYHIPFTNKIKLSAGISGGTIKYRLNTNEVFLANQNDPTLYDNDISRLKFNLSVGLWLYSQRFYLGLAGNQLLRNNRDFETNGQYSGPGSLQKHYVLTGGVRFDVAPTIAIVPSVQVNVAFPSPASYDFNLKAIYSDRFWVGSSYRHGDAFAGLAGVNISPILDLGYSYDVTTSELSSSNAGSHEIVIGFKLQNRGKVICPIWMW
ncbi:PorP/SprF family type IX secretion system membrane protein [Adhaeribacter radiodurans]|uniref:Type IX secretion system membrane protein PorP/SprF n=1 Tax=Adhaeribacter radiodurans TaxID=2745197 RepID=A0A7L7L8T8_9BACT|nr:type IX secretion system membrane protein PorP/SprF [Adhaeribacter radiodurans]QMU29231.1 type IX secretion system membrane protein PorP/SprF [Adhaeribacter radiodurans]